MSTLVLAQVPDPNVPAAVTADELTLIWMNNNVIDRNSVGVIALDTGGASIPDLDGAVLRASNHPFALAVEGYAGDVASVPFESENGVRVCRFEIVELDVMISCGCKIALLRRDAQAVHLRVWMLNRSQAYSR